MDTRKALTRAAIALGAYGLLARPKMLHWGATRDEIRAPFPRENLIPNGKRTSIMAATLDAPPSKVFPWLLQMGYDKGGWYSWDLLDNLGKPSTDRLHPEWQNVGVGDIMYGPNDLPVFEIVALERDRFLALRTLLGRRDSRHDDTDGLWAFDLQERPGDRTRLVVNVVSPQKIHWPNTVIDVLFWQPAHWIMQLRQFQNLKRLTRSAA